MAEAVPQTTRCFATRIVLAALLVGCAPAQPRALDPIPEPWSDSEVEAATALLALEDARDFDVPTIASAVASPSARVRMRAALAAGRIRPDETRPFIRLLLQDEDTAVAATAAFVAGQVRDSASVETLAFLLSTRLHHPTVAAEAAAALGKIGTERAREVLRQYLTGADSMTRPALVTTEALTAGWRAGEPSLAPFARWLGDADPEIRWRAAYALTRRARPDAVHVLLPLVADSAPLVRAFAIRGLAQPLVSAAGVSLPEAMALIIARLDDPAYPVRIEAIRVLGTYTDPTAIQALESMLASESPHEVVAALESFVRLGAAARRSLPLLRRLLRDQGSSSHIREGVVSALFTIDTDALSALADSLVLDPDWRVRSALATAQASQRERGLSVLRPLVRDPDPRVSVRALSAIVESFDPATLTGVRPLLLERLQAADVHVRAAALDGLSVLADPSTFPALLDAYDSAQRDIESEAALAAIEAIAGMRSAGVNPERAFFARFMRHNDYLVRARAVEHFGSAAIQAWGSPHPIDSGMTADGYRQAVSNWIAVLPEERAFPRVVIHSESGMIELEIFADAAPLTTSNFLELAGIGYFDGQEWPRVVPNFVVQGGDPRGDTSGGPGYSIRDELNRFRFGAGTVGMALSGPDTGGSQFFITHSPQPHLDGGYTVFGRVLVGQDVIERIVPGEQILSVEVIGDDVDF